MAVREESVRLSLTDDFTSGMARAAAATALFKRELNGLDGKNVSRDLDDTGKSIDRVGASSRKSGPEIDRFDGRLRLLADTAITLGPALVPLGAATIPVLTAALAGLGAAAGGIGVAVLAFKGLGDGLKAIDAYQLEPTAQNLAALRMEMEKLGPAGAHFVHFLDDLEPALKDLQNTARAGLLPGVEDGITDLMTRLPQVRRIVADLSEGMGDLARSAGESLGGDDFTAFFDYIESDARPTLEAFAGAMGNFTLGLGNLLVGFAPLTRDFTSGFEDMARSFEHWSEGLDSNQSFQDFLAYIRKSGPQAIEFLGALAQALTGLIHAAAPLGSAVLPALTGLAKAFSAIAKSPIGPPLYTAAAAILLFNRAASTGVKATTALSTGLERLGGKATTAQAKIGLLSARGGVVLAGAVAVGMLTDSMNRIDPTNLERSLEALKFGDVTETVDKVISSIDNLESKWNAVDLGKIVHAGGLFGDSSLEKFADNVEQVDQALAQLVESGNADEAATLFNKLTDLASAKGVDPAETAKHFDAYSQALKNVAAETAAAAGSQGHFRSLIGGVGGDLHAAAMSAEELSGALADLNGWFDKRQALRDYRDSIKELSKGLKDGFTRQDVENIDAAGRSLLQVAEGIKDPALREDFLAGARKSLVDVANNSGPKAADAIQRVINKLDSEGLTHPVLIPLGVDDKATPTLDELDIHLRRTGEAHPSPKVGVDPGNSFSILGAIDNMLTRVDRDVKSTISITTIRNSVNGGAVPPDFPSEKPSAGGGTVPKSGRPYADRYHYLLADGEEVISNRYGQADRHRGLLKAINAGRLADGGTARRPPNPSWNVGGGAFWEVADAADDAADGLKGLKAELSKAEKALDKQSAAVDSISSAMSSLGASVSSKFDVDLGAHSATPWASGGGVLSQISTMTSQANGLPAIIAALKAAGLSGPALSEVLQEMDFSQLQALAADPSQAGALSTALSGLYTAQQAAGSAAGTAVYGAQLDTAVKELAGIRAEVRELRKDVRAADKKNQDGHKENAEDVGHWVNGAASNGHRRGHRGSQWGSR